MLPPEHFGQGIDVRFIGERIAIDLHVVVEYGLRIADVAHEAMVRVKIAVEQMLGLPVVQVNIIVQGLRIGDPVED